MKTFRCLAVTVALVALHYVSFAQQQMTVDRPFDSDWRFKLDSVVAAEQPGFDDSGWRLLDLPHDWSIEDISGEADAVGPFSKKSPGEKSTGHVLGGVGWYRKTFVTDARDAGKLFTIYFEGSYMETDVWVNGRFAGDHKYGYTSFFFDITPYLNPPGQKNVVAVKVVNNGKNSRWYSGSGLYRHVKLIVTDKLHFAPWGIFITTPQVGSESARIEVASLVRSASAQGKIKIQLQIMDARSKFVATDTREIVAGKEISVLQVVTIKNPALWSVDRPTLYKARVNILQDGVVKDSRVISFGIRSVNFSAAKGFELNGQSMKLKGACIHHDNGVLGAAAIDRAEERKVEILKANGFNAIRCSHNPPSEKFLEACDRLGMLVIDESFDHWQKPKNPQDYHRFFDAWWEKDFTSMMLRDRNHPSIILWSIGNEIQERFQPSGLQITRNLKQKARELDPSRKITEAICHNWDNPGKSWDESAAAFALLDVGGYNYQWKEYENDHQKHPERIMMGTESVPKEALQNWNMVERHPYVIGDFVWTGMDYMGESGIGHTVYRDGNNYQLQPWPWFNAWCGDIDLIGNKKPQSYYRDVVWRSSPVEMAVHVPVADGKKEFVSFWGWPDEERNWNWTGNEGKPMDVNVYSRASLVRLLLNGKLVGEGIPDSLLTVAFRVPYQPGILKAIAFENGKEVGSVYFETTGKPASIRLIADRKQIKANRNDLSYISVEVLDAKGRLVPDARIAVHFNISGNAELVGAGNGNPAEMASFKQPARNSFRGKGLLVLRPKTGGGLLQVTATAEGLPPATISVTAR